MKNLFPQVAASAVYNQPERMWIILFYFLIFPDDAEHCNTLFGTVTGQTVTVPRPGTSKIVSYLTVPGTCDTMYVPGTTLRQVEWYVMKAVMR